MRAMTILAETVRPTGSFAEAPGADLRSVEPRRGPGRGHGRELRQREAINRGNSDRPIANGEIVTKFKDNITLAVPTDRADAVRAAVLGLDRANSARDVASQLSA